MVLATCEVPFKAAPGVEACTKKLIKMRNIYGNQTWFGDWSNDHRTWNKDNRRLTGYPQDAQDDCIFWMAIEDFVKNYNTVLTCQGFESAPEVFYRHLELQREGALPFYAHQYLLTVVDPFDPGFQNAQKRKEAEKQTKRTRPNLLHVKVVAGVQHFALRQTLKFKGFFFGEMSVVTLAVFAIVRKTFSGTFEGR